MTLRTLLIKLGFKGDVKKLADFDKKITGLKSNVLGLGAVFATATASLAYFLNEAAKLEQTKIAFEVMTNSVQLGRKLIKDLFTFARTTPFRIPGVLQASKILLAMGITADEQIDTLTKLGHVAAGINKPLDQLASIFGRVKAAGYLTGYEMERLRRAGVPLGKYLAEMLKKPERDVLHLIRSKQISFEVFADAWELMVKERFPKLMDRLLLTFKGIVSNIQDYIYEIVAFSGEELLPVFKLMANQLMFLLDSSRKLIGLKFKQFFAGVSSALALMNKGFVKLYFRTRETITQFGGINKLFKIFITMFSIFTGMKTLSLIGKLSKIFLKMLTLGSVKMSLLGAGVLLLFLATEDFFGYLIGKKSTIGYFLDLFENKFPNAFKRIKNILDIMKDSIEAISFLTFGFFKALITGDIDILEKGLKKFSETYNKITKKDISVKREKPYFEVGSGLGYSYTKEYIEKEARKPIKQYEKQEKLSKLQERYGKVGGKLAMAPGWIPILELGKRLQTIGRELGLPIGPSEWHKRYWQKERVTERISKKGELLREGLKSLNINIPTEVHFNNLPSNVDRERIISEINGTMKTAVNEAIGERLKTELSAVEPSIE